MKGKNMIYLIKGKVQTKGNCKESEQHKQVRNNQFISSSSSFESIGEMRFLLFILSMSLLIFEFISICSSRISLRVFDKDEGMPFLLHYLALLGGSGTNPSKIIAGVGQNFCDQFKTGQSDVFPFAIQHVAKYKICPIFLNLVFQKPSCRNI